MTPTVCPARSRGRRTGPSARAITEASGALTIGITPTRSRPRSRAIPRSWMSRIANSARPAASSFGASVDSPGCWIRSADPGVLVEIFSLRGEDPAVDGVGSEIEHDGRAFRHARFRAIPTAAGGAGDQEDGRQQRDSTSHFAPEPNSLSKCG